MRVYLSDLAAYPTILIGRWVELGGIDEEELEETIKEILEEGQTACKDGSIHEEYFLTDWETDEGFFEVGEYSDVFKLNDEVARFNELDDDSAKKCVSFLMATAIVSTLDEALEKYEEVYLYEDMSSFTDLAYLIVEEQYNLDDLPDFVGNYFDYEAFGRDLELEGLYTQWNGDIFYYPY